MSKALNERQVLGALPARFNELEKVVTQTVEHVKVSERRCADMAVQFTVLMERMKLLEQNMESLAKSLALRLPPEKPLRHLEVFLSAQVLDGHVVNFPASQAIAIKPGETLVLFWNSQRTTVNFIGQTRLKENAQFWRILRLMGAKVGQKLCWDEVSRVTASTSAEFKLSLDDTDEQEDDGSEIS